MNWHTIAIINHQRAKDRRKKKGKYQQSAKQLTLEEKLAQYLNETLSFENAAVLRLQPRIKEIQLEDAKQQLQQHLEVTKEQQNRLKQLITGLGAKPTNDSGQLPILVPPKTLADTLKNQ
ncbi:MAG TPA: DUF892 family protein [Nitrososphaera sp.]|nr:DUF892 family protein [Nitrososphaera sp.]